MIRNCLHCKKEFELQSSGQRYCDEGCNLQAHPKICETCNEVFYHKSKRRFCSLVCANKRIRKPRCNISICPKCGIEFDNNYHKGRKYCSMECSSSVNSGAEHGIKIFGSKRGQSKAKTILDINPAARCRLFRKMKLECSRCGYNKTNCDIHHINGRKINDPHNQSNLCYLCPNCHREVGQNLISVDELISFETQVGMNWKQFYSGCQ